MLDAASNIGRVLRELGIKPFVTIERNGPDRVWGIARPELLTYVQEHGWTRDLIIDPIHIGARGSYREPGAVMPALQVCFLADGAVEIDLDLAAPLGGDVASALVHAAEVFWHKLTGRKSNQQRMVHAINKRFGKPNA